MNEAGIILAVMAGVLVGIAGGLLFLAGKNRQMVELKESIRNFEEDTNVLREKLAAEGERRAAAEEKSSRISELEENLEKAKLENSGQLTKLSELRTRLEDERKNAEEKLTLLQEAREQLKMEFQNVANKIFEDKSRKFTDQNRENIEGVLKPMREQLLDFKKKVEDVYDKESKDRISLLNEIIHLKELVRMR
jgi:DNA recombination protein RmuC